MNDLPAKSDNRLQPRDAAVPTSHPGRIRAGLKMNDFPMVATRGLKVSKYQSSLLVLLVSLLALPCLGEGTNETVTVPIPSVYIYENECTTWRIMLTYTATPMPADILNDLAPYSRYTTLDHFHANGYPGPAGRWNTPTYVMSGTPRDKLNQINQHIFGTDKPRAWATASNYVQHTGTCAADEGLRECVGVFVSNQDSEIISKSPTVFPVGMCSGVPPVGASCSFDSSTKFIDLGVGGPGERRGATSVSVSCTRPVVYRVNVLKNSPDPNGLSIDSVRVGGRFPPYLSKGDQKHETLTVDVRATASSEGRFFAQRILRIDIP